MEYFHINYGRIDTGACGPSSFSSSSVSLSSSLFRQCYRTSDDVEPLRHFAVERHFSTEAGPLCKRQIDLPWNSNRAGLPRRLHLVRACRPKRHSQFVFVGGDDGQERTGNGGDRGKTTEELNEEIVDLKGELFMLRLQKSARNEFKSSEFRRMRKRVARMLTVKRERELEQGINKRLSRKLDRQWKKSIVVRPPPSLKKLREEEAAAEAKESA
ncbi:hypothetical protein NMG60_11007345 [Bertholletia excelsa]